MLFCTAYWQCACWGSRRSCSSIQHRDKGECMKISPPMVYREKKTPIQYTSDMSTLAWLTVAAVAIIVFIVAIAAWWVLAWILSYGNIPLPWELI